MPKGKVTNRQATLQTQRFVTVVNAAAGVLQMSIKYECIAAVAYCGYRSLGVLSGKATTASFILNVLGDLKANEYAAYLFGGGGCLWAIGERRLRRKRVAELSKHTKNIEAHLDTKGRRVSFHYLEKRA